MISILHQSLLTASAAVAPLPGYWVPSRIDCPGCDGMGSCTYERNAPWNTYERECETCAGIGEVEGAIDVTGPEAYVAACESRGLIPELDASDRRAMAVRALMARYGSRVNAEIKIGRAA